MDNWWPGYANMVKEISLQPVARIETVMGKKTRHSLAFNVFKVPCFAIERSFLRLIAMIQVVLLAFIPAI